MKIRLALMIGLIAIMLSACSYWIVEESPMQIGSPIAQERALKR